MPPAPPPRRASRAAGTLQASAWQASPLSRPGRGCAREEDRQTLGPHLAAAANSAFQQRGRRANDHCMQTDGRTDGPSVMPQWLSSSLRARSWRSTIFSDGGTPTAACGASASAGLPAAAAAAAGSTGSRKLPAARPTKRCFGSARPVDSSSPPLMAPSRSYAWPPNTQPYSGGACTLTC
jgi:hypothetical protein